MLAAKQISSHKYHSLAATIANSALHTKSIRYVLLMHALHMGRRSCDGVHARIKIIIILHRA